MESPYYQRGLSEILQESEKSPLRALKRWRRGQFYQTRITRLYVGLFLCRICPMAREIGIILTHA